MGGRLLGVALMLSIAMPAVAHAQTKTVTVDPTVVVKFGQKPGDPGNCSSVVFAQWPHRANVVSATVKFAIGASASPRSVTRDGPAFDNHLVFVATYDVPPGSDWIAFASNARDGPGVETCEAASVRLNNLIVRPVTVELQVTIDAAACSAARKKLVTKQKAVTKLQGRVSAAKGAEKARLKRALKAAKKSRDAAKAKVTATC